QQHIKVDLPARLCEVSVENKLRMAQASPLPDILRAGSIGGEKYGYLRIYSFKVKPEALLDAVLGMLRRIPKAGLVIDLRGNPGGQIAAAERLLQLFTPRRVEGSRFQFLNSSETVNLSEGFDESKTRREQIE